MRLVIALALLLGSPLAAQESLRLLDGADEARIWQAVGRLDIADGAALCSATLISDRLVLTAAHCLFHPGTGRPVAPSDVEFQPGWRNGGAAAYRTARRFVLHPEFLPNGDDWAYRLARDIALIELDQPIRASSIAPLRHAARMPSAGWVSVVSYAMGRQNAPAIEDLCAVIAREDAALLLSCTAGPGASGAPILARISGEVQVVAMISAVAQWGGGQVSAGVEIGPALALLEPLLGAAPGGITLRPANGGSLNAQLGRTTP